MLPQNSMVAIKKAKESMYTGLCTIINYVKTINSNKSTSIREQISYKDVPCRLSISSAPQTNQTESYNAITKTIKLFLSPDVIVNPGDKIIVTQNNVTDTYKNTSKPSIYTTHQEITLEIYKDKA